MRERLWRPMRFGLRARVITAFAVGAFLLSILLSSVTYSLTSANLLEQREQDVLLTAVQNAQAINAELGRAAFVDPATEAEANGDALVQDLVQRYVVPLGSNQGIRVRGDY